ncbi:Hsp90 co-chaperone Cdc37 [Wickerhamomyces ciferrii]|uniref:Hsp90 chaperone protein kinase-targeting subunit n=1 Tax=Wickerhamomyces ciferrii (strain ATCC 14091 / BCRC 22168 / CBS 111 / JCM 3599 / NBRC 0793 / NRRL Y-1031 F-60-10) TaxID=1206466 RepID=K0KH82_WICCF|nr:Hsp90 co-chaperone Cdc37 [Wickerhamomyces ciferrii]CCH41537.1 Hsp90 co-chaperone Cdc37 [Wickerhamomyces ciferrii]
MAIDYSKWDKIELSDDSDVEVHPNVDKKSFIRWKQQDIHQKRDQRNHDIKTLEVQNAMYDELNKRVDKLLSSVSDLADFDQVKTYLQSNFDPNSKPDGIEEDGPTHNEMIEDLFTQLKADLENAAQDPSNGESVKTLVLAHRKKIDDVLERNHLKLKELYKERELHISSDDIHTGWDRSFLNKGDDKNASKDQSKTEDVRPSTSSVSSAASAYSKPSAAIDSDEKSKSEEAPKSNPVEKQNPEPKLSPSNNQEVAQASNVSNAEEEETIDDLHPDTFSYSKIPIEKIDQIKSFLKSHTHIITPNQKDSLLMKAFDAQFAHDNKRTYQIIFLSTILQYVHDIVEFKRTRHPQEISLIVEQLLSKMFINSHNQAFEAFKAEVQRTYAHIKQRCEILTQEQYEDINEEDQEIQLKSLDENSELIVNLPDSNSKDPNELKRFEIFQELPEDMQNALKTESLDEVNKVFRGMPIKQAEGILEIFEQCEVIGVQAVIENENDWREIKHEYEQSQSQSQSQPQSQKFDNTSSDDPKIEELGIEDQDFENTADIVD